MYSRFPQKSELRVPSNYSGNAFSFERPKYEPPVVRESDVIVLKAEVEDEACEKADASIPEICEKCEKEDKSEPNLFGFSVEDLLIIALILILSGNGAEDDILLALAMILAYKK